LLSAASSLQATCQKVDLSVFSLKIYFLLFSLNYLAEKQSVAKLGILSTNGNKKNHPDQITKLAAISEMLALLLKPA